MIVASVNNEGTYYIYVYNIIIITMRQECHFSKQNILVENVLLYHCCKKYGVIFVNTPSFSNSRYLKPESKFVNKCVYYYHCYKRVCIINTSLYIFRFSTDCYTKLSIFWIVLYTTYIMNYYYMCDKSHFAFYSIYVIALLFTPRHFK